MSTLNCQELKKEFVEKNKKIDRKEKLERSRETTLETLRRIQNRNLPWKYDIFAKSKL